MINFLNEAIINNDGNYVLSGKHYKNETFDNFLLGIEENRCLIILDTIFDNCKTTNGFFVTKKVALKNVKFINFDCGDALHINSETYMENVQVTGSKPKTLWIKPTDKTIENSLINSGQPNRIIDISNYEGEVSITGIPVSRIIFNPEKQIPLTQELHEKIDWKSLQFSPSSYWKLMIRKIFADGAKEGIFSIPPVTNKNYQRSMQELNILKTHGYVN